ncbi:MAG: MFS transporter [Chloroflexi bacterium]|nr:MAG: MFS transporter [Chloroflexota bacterium]
MRDYDVTPPEGAAVPRVPPDTPTALAVHDPYAALRFPDFRWLTLGQFISTLGTQMVGVAVGWELYERTNSAFALGFVGLVQVLPVILLSLPAGHAADRYDRRRLVVGSQLLLALCSLGLALISFAQGPLALVYACLFGIGVARAFSSPASSTLLPQTVPPQHYANAATWGSSTWQLAAVMGPTLGGFLIAVSLSAALVYLCDVVACLLFVLALSMVRGRQVARSTEALNLRSLLAGVHFLRQNKILLAAITLDLFAVLLGGATTLLPVFARDILQVGPTGLGWLRAAPSIGALAMAIILAYLPPIKRAGRVLLWAVAGFGVATVVFGLSRSFALSFLMLGLLGAFDNVSVVIRHTLLLVLTPDELRGRISAVNSVFIGASNELGGFESGVAAALLGPITAVAAGGIGTILVVLVVALVWPEMRRLGRLESHP